MSVQLDMKLRNRALVTNNGRYIDECVAITDYLAAKAGGEAYQVVVSSSLCGTRDGNQRHLRHTRSGRARRIRRELKPELQAVGLLPAGPIIWLILTSPTLWLFLFTWIRGVLADVEE